MGDVWMGTGDRALVAGALMLGWIALLWILEAVDLATGHGLDDHGISPREPGELLDIVHAAFLHDGLFGLIGGVAAAFALRRPTAPRALTP